MLGALLRHDDAEPVLELGSAHANDARARRRPVRSLPWTANVCAGHAGRRRVLRQHEPAMFVSPGVDFCLGRDCAQDGCERHEKREEFTAQWVTRAVDRVSAAGRRARYA